MKHLLRKIPGPPLTIVIILLTAAILLACGPAAQSAPGEQPASQPAPQSTETTPTDTPESTDTPEPATREPTPTSTYPPAPTKSGPTPVPRGTACHPAGGNLYTGNFYYKGPENVEYHLICYQMLIENVFRGYHKQELPSLWAFWSEMQQTVAQDQAVATAHKKVLTCLAGQGHAEVKPEFLFFWQNFQSPEDYGAKLTGYTADERVILTKLARPADECAGPSGYYAAQSAAWRAEVKRLMDQAPEEPEKLKLIASSSIFFVTQQPGTLHFLTLDGAIPVTGIGGTPNATPHPNFPDPTPTPRPTSIPISPHPQGLAGCRNLSIFAYDSQEFSHSHWCNDAALNAVISQCGGTGTTQEERACAENYLASWKGYHTRLFFPCYTISNLGAARECVNQAAATLRGSQQGLGQLWTEIQPAVSSNTDVATAHQKVIQCLADRSYSDVAPKLLFTWQTAGSDFGDPDAANARIDSLTPEEKELMEKVAEPADQCAENQGLYEAQDAAWLAAVRRLVEEDPARAQPLLDWAILEILEQPGIAPFLTKP